MSKYNVGDLVWIPDGTVSHTKKLSIGATIRGPVYGLVVELIQEALNTAKWLRVQIGNDKYIVAEKKVRKIGEGW